MALPKIMSQFAEGEIDILVCSTIIENGLDISNVNTLIVEDADRFGLSSLYQIRGRIGRSPKQSYALFTYKNKTITTNAHKRLKALLDNSELGSGYNIALSDLEIRGGGNILGREQHGNMEAIGLVLYTKLLNQAVMKLNKKSV
jgi:transcription-repair coupling factor (superfamily II helicase)